MILSRRLVVQGLAVLAGGAAAPVVAWAQPWATDENRAVDALSRLFSDADAVRGLGRVCHRACAGRPPSVLLRAIARDLNLPISRIGRLEPAHLRQCLRRRVQADFAHGTVVDVAGWRLSRTELKVYAVLAAVG